MATGWLVMAAVKFIDECLYKLDDPLSDKTFFFLQDWCKNKCVQGEVNQNMFPQVT